MSKYHSVWLLTAFFITSVEAQIDTSISYQGELTRNGLSAEGLHDFSFTLFDDLESGLQIGDTLLIEDIEVSQGIFTVVLDFGPGTFVGDKLWLEVAVQADNSNDFETLHPRQSIQAAPYALHAEMVALDAIGSTEIINNSITGDDIANQTINATHLQDGSGSQIDADLLDGMDSQDFAQQAVIDNLNNTITALQQQLSSLNDLVVNGPKILGRTAMTSNARFEFNNETGSQAANPMCQATFPDDPGAHMCTTHEVQRALASKRFPSDTSSINNQRFWTVENTFYNHSSWQNNSVHSNCSGLLENASDVAHGTTMTLMFNQQSGGNGGNLNGDFFDLQKGVYCGTNLPVLCCL
ncbi:hypothetical protein [Marinicella rhabdoformis]|uniref:hypothetical protein n=1 Tax=Marinicella rhabdoformis TaxID=2580566 RepID=UPI0012AEC927|nr:hypothetical protein [Marinicella rhabdoformis]